MAEYDLQILAELDGFDVGLGRMGQGQWTALAAMAVRELALEPGLRLLDVGCGAGALLWCLRDRGLELFGVDYSASLLSHARRAIPEAQFAVAEATDLPFEVDAIVCNSVFHYFPDYGYAQRVLDAFSGAAPVALISDVPDKATGEEAERARREAGSKPATHLYYPRSFFKGAKTWTNELPGYGNARFHFNALVEHDRPTAA